MAEHILQTCPRSNSVSTEPDSRTRPANMPQIKLCNYRNTQQNTACRHAPDQTLFLQNQTAEHILQTCPRSNSVTTETHSRTQPADMPQIKLCFYRTRQQNTACRHAPDQTLFLQNHTAEHSLQTCASYNMRTHPHPRHLLQIKLFLQNQIAEHQMLTCPSYMFLGKTRQPLEHCRSSSVPTEPDSVTHPTDMCQIKLFPQNQTG